MSLTVSLLTALFFLLLSVSMTIAAVPAGLNWPGWRGDGSGISKDTKLPLVWSKTRNVFWRTPLLAEGSSSPIIWGDNVFLTASTAAGNKRLVLCFNVKDGKLRWQKEITATNVPETDPKSGYAPATPVTDGQRVYVFFDSPGLVALDMQGNILWTVPLGPFKSPYNVANSPILYKDSLIMCCDHTGASFIMAVDKATGKVIWKTPRNLSMHFATPLLITTQGKSQIIVNANVVKSYDADSGKELWSCSGNTPTVTPSPIFDHGLVFVTSGRNGPAMAIDPSGSGDIKETHVRMHVTTGGPYVPSPLACPTWMLPGDDGNIRFINDQGAIVYNLRLRSHFTASPVANSSYIYWLAENGDTFVIDIHKLTAKTPEASVVAINSLGEICLASPAIANGRIFLRTEKALYCLAGTGLATPPPSRTITETFAELKARFDAHAAPNGPDVPIRLAIIEDLGVMQDAQAIPFLRKVAVEDPHWDVSEAAIKALAQYNDVAAIPELLAMFKDWRAYLKVPAAEGLGRLQAVNAIPTMLSGMKDSDPQVRIACTEALAQITLNDKVALTSTLPALLGMTKDADGAVRAAALHSLAVITAKPGLNQDSIIEVLMKGTQDSNPMVSDAAREALKAYNITPLKMNELMKNITLYGSPIWATTSYNLTAGPLRLKFQYGELRYIYVGDKEIVRRIYFAVRDMNYDTIMPVLTRCDVEKAKDSFTIHLEAICKSTTADYSWIGDIVGTSAGKITFKVSGKTNGVFATPRIGINVLYGTPSLAEQAYTLTLRDGKSKNGIFPKDVAPGVFEDNFATLSYTLADGMMVSCGITGAGFGMEDQRNYGDSSYKAFHGLGHKAYVNLPVGDEQNDTLTLSVQNVKAQPPVVSTNRIIVGEPGAMTLPKLSFIAKAKVTESFPSINGSRIKYATANSLTWSFNPASHMPDEDTFMENLPTIVDQVRTVRTFLPAGATIHIDALGFDSPYPRPARDSRNQGLFGAAWLAAALANVSKAGVDDIVTTVGPGPSDKLLKEYIALAGKPLLNVSVLTSQPKPIEAFGINNGEVLLLWMINLTDQPQKCTVTTPQGKETCTVSRLNMSTVAKAVIPEEKVTRPLLISLAAYEVCRMTITAAK